MAAPPPGRGFLSSDRTGAAHRPPRDSSEDVETTARAIDELLTVSGASSAACENASEGITEQQQQQVSKLNVGAQEFRPLVGAQVSWLNADVQALRSSAQLLSPCATPFVPGGGGGEPLDGDYSFADAGEPESSPVEDDMEVMLRTQETLAELGRAPGRFGELVPALLEDIYPLVRHKQTLQNLADVIVDSAVSSPNVSYTGAQLCAQLEFWGFAVDDEVFVHCLFRKCAATTKKLSDAPRSPRTRHFAMFLAEIFLALVVVEEGGRTVRRQALGKGVKRLLLRLLAEPDDDDIKCVVQVLKLCGSELACCEEAASDVASQSAAAAKPSLSATSMSDVLVAVKESRACAGQSCQRLIDSVLALQASGWGRSQVSPNAVTPGANESHQPTEQPFNNEPVFYSPDGRQITRREAGFGNAAFAGIDEDEGQPDADQLAAGVELVLQLCNGDGDIAEGGLYDDDPDLNDEIIAAYVKFCEENSRGEQ